MNKPIDTVLNKNMNRREFFGFMGAAILALIGVTGMINALLHHADQPHHGPVRGYGSVGYGKS